MLALSHVAKGQVTAVTHLAPMTLVTALVMEIAPMLTVMLLAVMMPIVAHLIVALVVTRPIIVRTSSVAQNVVMATALHVVHAHFHKP
jgi:predicted metal-binding membrane protein